MKVKLVCLVTAVFSTGAFAFPKPLLTRDIDPIERPALIVVHAQKQYDFSQQGRAEIDRVISRARAEGHEIIFLMNNETADWYTRDQEPDLLFVSFGGEHRLPVRNPDVTLVGGFFGTYDMSRGCLSFAMRNVVNSYFNLQKQPGPLLIHIPVAGVYFWPENQRLRAQILDKSVRPSVWLNEFIGIAFTKDGSEKEVGHADLVHSDIRTVKNPFAPGRDETISPAPVPAEPGKAETIPDFELYASDPPLGTKNYRFEILVDGKVQRAFGKGPRQVQLSIER